jgi:serine/threonine-protein kinase HipA
VTSETCYVYIQLPGSLEVVTCGRYQREQTDEGVAVGRFVYGQTFLSREDAVALDPFHLPLSSREYTTVQLDGVFGALRDILPDFWGRRVIERREHTTDFSEFDYLVYPSRGRIGALEFGAEVAPKSLSDARLPGLHHLSELREVAANIESGAPIDPDLEDLLAAGSSVGGARPKTVIRDEAGTWLAKFPAKEDRWSNAAVEGGMLRLASECGIRTPETRLEMVSDEQVLLVKRFDRELASEGADAEYRHRMVSALTVLDLDDREVVDRSGWSYLLLADELQRWSTEPLLDKRELFRRMVFNALISNTDDHPRNHALIAPPEGWRLSPAYDLTPSPVRSLESRELAMAAGKYGRHASRQNLLSASPRFGFDQGEANAVIDDIIGIVEGRWRQVILEHGGSDADCDAVSRAFVYEGFEYPM